MMPELFDLDELTSPAGVKPAPASVIPDDDEDETSAVLAKPDMPVELLAEEVVLVERARRLAAQWLRSNAARYRAGDDLGGYLDDEKRLSLADGEWQRAWEHEGYPIPTTRGQADLVATTAWYAHNSTREVHADPVGKTGSVIFHAREWAVLNQDFITLCVVLQDLSKGKTPRHRTYGVDDGGSSYKTEGATQ